MLYTMNPALAKHTQIRILGIIGFAVLMGISARISIPLEPVPITMQPFVVLLAGLTLGPRDGFFSIVTYLAAIASGIPVDAKGLGSAAFSGPTAGYLLAFPVAAGLVGMMAIRNHFAIRLLAGIAGIAVIYLIGTTYLKFYADISWNTAWTAGVKPFILLDLAKAVIAAGLGEGARQWWNRQLMG